MIRLSSLFIALVLSFASFAQKESYNWVFGSNIGIDFTSGSPVFQPKSFATFATTGSGYTLESSSSISSNAGKPLFFVSGKMLYNAMTNTKVTDLRTTNDAAQGSMIVPKPGTSNQYYIFTVDAYPQSCGGTAEFGSGFGANYYTATVNEGAKTVNASTHTALPSAPTTIVEGQTICPSSTTNQLWYITHEVSNNKFKVYKVNASGVTFDHDDAVGTIYNGCSHLALKFNSCFTQLAVVYGSTPSNTNNVVVYDFNKATGVISNPQSFTIANAYGAEFSDKDPMGNSFLYVSQSFINGQNNLYKLPISPSGTVSTPSVFAALNGNTNNNSGDISMTGQLQIGPDGNIYVADKLTFVEAVGNTKHYVGVILNASSSSASFNSKYISISDPNGTQLLHVGMGLPNIPRYLVGNMYEIINQQNQKVSSLAICKNDIQPLEFSVGASSWKVTNPSNTVQNFTGSTVSAYNFSLSGWYKMEVTYTSSCGDSKIHVDSVLVKDETIPAYSLPTYSCAGPNGILITGLTGTNGTPSNYVWYDSDAVTLLGRGATYLYTGTLPVAPLSKRLYIEDQTPLYGPFTVGPTFTTKSSSTTFPKSTSFTVNKSLTLKSVDMILANANFSNYCNNNTTITVKVQQNNQDVPGMSKNYTHKGCDIAFTVPLDFNLSAGNYSLVVSSAGTFFCEFSSSYTGPFTDTQGLITIKEGASVFSMPTSGPFSKWVVQQSNPCTRLMEVSIVDNCCDQLQITSHPSNVTVCQNSTTQLVVSSSPNVTYKWQIFTGVGYMDLQNSVAYNGVNNDTLTITSDADLVTRKYRVVISNGACVKESNDATYTVSVCTGIQDVDALSSSSVYPNPVSDVLHLPAQLSNRQIRILSTDGREVTVIDAINQIDVHQLSSGMYFIKADGESKVVSFIKK